MGLYQRIKRLWELSAPRPPKVITWNGYPVSKEEFDRKMNPPQYAEFIMPNRAEEIIKSKPDATVDDVLV